MINQRPCVNGIIAAVLSASFLPMHGALAKEPTAPAAKHINKHVVKKPVAAAHKPSTAVPTPPEAAVPGDPTGALPSDAKGAQ